MTDIAADRPPVPFHLTRANHRASREPEGRRSPASGL